MRQAIFATMALLAACSESAEEKAAAKAAAADALKLEAGEWEWTSEVVNMKMVGKDPKPLPLKTGTKTTAKSCITPDQVEKPQPAVFAGSNGSCDYQDFYMRRGRVVATVLCQPPEGGELSITTEGSYTADSLEARVNMQPRIASTFTYMVAESKLTGRRIGACPAGAADPAVKS